MFLHGEPRRGRSQAGVDVVAAMVRSESGWCEPPVDLASGNFLKDEASIMYKWTVEYKASPQWSSWSFICWGKMFHEKALHPIASCSCHGWTWLSDLNSIETAKSVGPCWETSIWWSKWVSGWWFGTWISFFPILWIIIPIDFHLFQRGGSTTNQVWMCLTEIYYLTLWRRNGTWRKSSPVWAVFQVSFLAQWIIIICWVQWIIRIQPENWGGSNVQ